MIFFGHLGITLGAAKVFENQFNRHSNSLKLKIDYRLILFGAILPDLIDKPIGHLFSSYFKSSRLFAHTLLFTVILLCFGLFCLMRYKKLGVLVMALACSFHQLLDIVNLMPKTFFWPLMGFEFGKPGDYESSIITLLTKLLQRPYDLIPEIFGFLLLLYLFSTLFFRRKLYKFFKFGEISI